MHRTLSLGLLCGMSFLLTGCQSSKYEAGQRDLARPINCRTAEGDIRMLRHEKAHVQDQVLAGVKAIMPAAAVVGVATGTEGSNISMAIGDYNKQIDNKIAAIKAQCGVD